MNNQRLTQLLEGTARRQEEAFTQLYQEFYPAVRSIAGTVLPSPQDAEDAAQEVFSLLWTLPPERFPTTNPGAWLYTVTRRQALAHIRGQRPVSLEDLPPLPDPSPGPQAVEDDEHFSQLLAPLDQESRQIVTLKLKLGMTHREIAQALGKKAATVRWKYAQALHALRLFWAGLLGALVCFGLSLWRQLPQAPTAGGPTEGGVEMGGSPLSTTLGDWLPGFLLALAGVLLLALAAVEGWQLWKKKKRWNRQQK